MIGQVLPPMCGPASTATPQMPIDRPMMRLEPSRSPPVNRSRTAAMIGDAAMSRPVIELVRWRSASESSHHAAMISKNANPSRALQWSRTIVHGLPGEGKRQQHGRADGDPGEHKHGNRHALNGDLDHQIGDTPDDAHREEQDPSARAHVHTLRNVDKRNSRVAAATITAAGIEPSIRILDADAKSLVFECDGEPLLAVTEGVALPVS